LLSRGRGDLVALGAAAVAVVCCAGLPLLGAAIGGLTAAAVTGLGAGALFLAVLAAVLVIRRRRARDVR
jgi:hypothetical protein